jgi:CRISPR-associated endonuclease Csn1
MQREHGIRRVQVVEKLAVIRMADAKAGDRHGVEPDGQPAAYKGYKGDSNYCIEIWRNEKGKWEGDVVPTFNAHEIAGRQGVQRLRHPALTQENKPLVMRLMLNDIVRLEIDGVLRTMRVATLSGNGQVFMADHNEANVDARNREKGGGFKYVSKYPGSLQAAKARRITVSPIGDLRDPGFSG